MAHDVFVSYSSKDKPIADAVCAMLESQGVRCWVAPRDILPGMEWGAAIVEAIRGARLMVLIFSTNANSSQQITREVERAVHKGIPVIPLRIEDVAPTASLEYFLSAPHWLDAFTPPLEGHLRHLVQAAQQILGIAPANPPPVAAPVATISAAPPPPAALPEIQRAKKPQVENSKGGSVALLISLGTVTLILLTLLAGWWFAIEQPRRKGKFSVDISSAAPKTLVVPGQHSTIQAAINAARAGDTIRVKEGIYSESLRLVEGIRLIGDGKDVVRVRGASTNNTLNCDGVKNGFVNGLTFEHAGKSNSAGSRFAVVSLGDGCAVEITNCRIQLGDGSGITVSNGSPKITACVLERNGRNGIAVTGSNARPVIARNQCRLNEQDGIFFLQGASGDVQGNVCETNGRNGIVAGGAGTIPRLQGNQSRGNGRDGIEFGDDASGELRENTCDGNKRNGISVYGKGANCKLLSNLCRTNTMCGIWCETGSLAVRTANQLSGNRKADECLDGRAEK
ncbi:MAG TPA: TIR domain-containing protein [Verrucomicrobiae bacterium]|jgi:parallel beta-helix repeat protein